MQIVHKICCVFALFFLAEGTLCTTNCTIGALFALEVGVALTVGIASSSANWSFAKVTTTITRTTAATTTEAKVDP